MLDQVRCQAAWAEKTYGVAKTTTIRILLGLLRKDGGDVSLLGGDPWRGATTLHGRLAYVPGDVTLWPSLTGGEIIDLLARLHLTRTTIDAELSGPVTVDCLAGVHDAVVDRVDGGFRLRCEVDDAALNEILSRLSAAGVRTLTCRPSTLEELFLRHYSERTVATVQWPPAPSPARPPWRSRRCAGTGSCCPRGSTWS